MQKRFKKLALSTRSDAKILGKTWNILLSFVKGTHNQYLGK